MFRRTTALAVGSAIAVGTAVGTAHAMPVLPDFSMATFDANSANLTHPYFPYAPGKTYRFEAESVDPDTGEVTHEQIIVEVLNGTRVVAGVTARIVRDRVYEEGLIIEDTFDWYAQDTAGNVWYVGEDVTDFHYDDDGNLIGTSHPGAWETGIDGALPGYIMPINPMVGDSYYQEFFLGEAEDYAEILGIDETFDLPGFGELTGVLRTADFSLDPDAFAHKRYAPGIGVFAEREFDTDTGALISSVNLVSITTIPEPSSAMLATTGMCALFVKRRRRET